MYNHILIPTDGSPLSQKAVAHGLDLAKSVGAKVTFASVTIPFHSIAGDPEMVVSMRDEQKKFVHDYIYGDVEHHLDEARAQGRKAGISCDVANIENDHVFQGIIDAATGHGCDLILMASHGRRGVSAILLGSETVKVLTHSTIPVLVYR